MDEKEIQKPLFEKYKQVHTEGKSDEDTETVSTKAKEYLATEKHFDKPKAFDFYRFMKDYIVCVIDKTYEKRQAVLLKDLQNVYRKLEDYGLRLLKRPWRKEFHTIKLFTTFFKHDIASKLPSAVKVLHLYGYREVQHNMVKMDSPNSDGIFHVCFELFLSRIELEVMSEICDSLDEYTSDYTLTDVVMVRRNTRGGARKAVESFLEENPNIKAKRMKTDDTVAMKKSKESYKFPSTDEETRTSDFYNGRITSHTRTTRDTKYPPSSAYYYDLPSGTDHGVAPVTGSAKVKHISSSAAIDNISDADLYGHSDTSSSSGHKANNIPMDTQEAQASSDASYYAALYEDMTYDHDTYEDMYSPDTGDSSCTTLPPPPGIPPPTYDQAAQIPGNDWVYLSNNISAMNIDENGHSQVVGVRGVHKTTDIRELKNRVGLTTSSYSSPTYHQAQPQAASTKAKEVTMRDVSSERQLLNGSYQDYKTPTTSFTTGFEKTLPEKSALYRFETSGGSSNGKTDLQRLTTSLGSYEKMSASKAQEHYDKDRLVRSGPEGLSTTRTGDLKSPAATMKVNERHIKDLTRSGPGELSSKRISDPSVSTAASKAHDQHIKDLTSNGSGEFSSKRISDPSVSTTGSKSYDQHVKDRLTRSGPDVFTTKKIGDPTATPSSYSTPSYPKGSSTSEVYSYPKTHEMTTRSQSKAAAANKPDLRESFQGTSKTTPQIAERYTKDPESCIVCNSRATHYCQMCKKRACRSCTTVVTRLPCESYKEHVLVEGFPTTSNEKAHLGSKGDCSFCGVSTASQSCIFCNKKSCTTCSTVYTKDPCVMDKTHHFMNQQQQKTSDERTASQRETTTPSSKGKKPSPASLPVTGENYCDFCALAADLICKDCLKTICTKCIYVYTQDLCPLTKREHHFENIVEQSSNYANKTTEGSSWSCERCTFLNSPSHRICAVCATSRGVNQVDMPKSGSRKCQNCTFANEEGATICGMCARTFGLENPESYI